MTSGPQLPPKKDVILALLESTDVFIHLDPRRDGVKVPAWFKHQPQLVLQVGLNMPVPIPDLEVDEASVSCTLSFNRSPFFCFMPWNAVYALVGADGRAMVWPDDVPAEVAAQAAQVVKKQKAPKTHLRAVTDDDDGPADEEATLETEAEAPERSQARQSAPPEPPPQPEAEAEETTKPSEPPGKKRELPPYLRVVK
ncbi:MAG: hypothetical protein H6717_21040 [Polyangiaceae bacterium]|nr:hypothetical protein [Polyangiaceae bacterium]